MKPISELVILALTARLRGALFLSYKTLTHFIICFLLYPEKDSNPQFSIRSATCSPITPSGLAGRCTHFQDWTLEVNYSLNKLVCISNRIRTYKISGLSRTRIPIPPWRQIYCRHRRTRTSSFAVP